MAKRLACYACHFGKEWIGYSVRTIQDAVDEVHVFYAPEPSYGFSVAGAVCPDTEAEIHAEVHRWARIPVFWHRVEGTRTEGQHKDKMLHVARERGAEAYILLDADELWDTQTAVSVVDHVLSAGKSGRWQAHFHHFWRSFDWMIADPFRPIRVVDMRGWSFEGGAPYPIQPDASLDETTQQWGVFHFGYAQAERTMRYKLTCHSHSPELRSDWLDKAFLPWTPQEQTHDLHPTQPRLWPSAVPTPAHVREKLHSLMPDHPYWGVEVIR